MTLWIAALSLVAGTALADDGWWTRQADLELASLTGSLDVQDIGGSPEFGSTAPREEGGGGGNFGKAVPMIMSAVLPGTGQIYLGFKQDRTSALLWGAGFLAADIFSWTQVASYNDEGDAKKDEYYAYADAHWREVKLDAAYNSGYPPGGPYEYVANLGNEYFAFTDETGSPIGGYQEIPLWVSREDDNREYYENLGKWDQFVFGWDDFVDPRDIPGGGYTGDPQSVWLDDPRTSANRETYRAMRRDSNDAYETADRYVYFSIGLRVVSVLHVAYLEGLLFGGDDGANELKVAGQQVQFIAQPVGLRAGVVAASMAF
jgi:hypothetical protein